QVLTEERIEAARTVAPATTRAHLRGQVVTAAQEHGVDHVVDWTTLRLTRPGAMPVQVLDPFATSLPEVDCLLAEIRAIDVPRARLSAAVPAAAAPGTPACGPASGPGGGTGPAAAGASAGGAAGPGALAGVTASEALDAEPAVEFEPPVEVTAANSHIVVEGE